MKKLLLAGLVLIMATSVSFAATTSVGSYLDRQVQKVKQAENNAAAKVQAKKDERAKAQAAQKARVEKAKKDAEARQKAEKAKVEKARAEQRAKAEKARKDAQARQAAQQKKVDDARAKVNKKKQLWNQLISE